MNNYERADHNLLQIEFNFYIEGDLCIEYTKGVCSIRYVRFEHKDESFYCEATPVNGLKYDDRWVWTIGKDGTVLKLSVQDVENRVCALISELKRPSLKLVKE